MSFFPFNPQLLGAPTSSLFTTGLLRTDVDKELKVGSTVSMGIVESRDGKVTKYTATRIYEVVQKDRTVYVSQNRTTAGGILARHRGNV